MNKRNITKEQEHKVWVSIKSKCFPSKNKQTKEESVGMYSEWAKSYETFLNYIGRKPTKDHYLVRKDTSKGFFPGNIMWSINKPGNTICKYKITYKGKTKGISYWSKITGINYGTLLSRKKAFWEDEKIIETQPNKNNKKERNYERVTSEPSNYSLITK